MSTLFEPSLSVSAMRPPLSTADAPSMADSLPPINFGFDTLRSRMASFTDRFDAYIADGRKRFLEERNQFRINVAELQEDQNLSRRDLEILSQKQSHHAASLAAQAAETEEMHTAIASITSQRDTHLTHRSAFQAQLTSIKTQIALRKTAQAARARELDAQAAQNAPELEFWESTLGVRIEGAGKADRLRFVFWNVDERDWEREAWFELDTERREYAVVGVRPKVPEGVVEGCVERLNESRDLGGFLREMREGFLGLMK